MPDCDTARLKVATVREGSQGSGVVMYCISWSKRQNILSGPLLGYFTGCGQVLGDAPASDATSEESICVRSLLCAGVCIILEASVALAR
jgi:hypothetical protein